MDTSFWARFDSNSANNPALNLQKDPAVEIEFIWASPTGDTGDVVLEQNGGAADPDSLVVIGGVSYSFIFEYTGTLPTTKKDGAQQVPDHLEGDAVNLITIVDYPSAGETTRLSFLPESNATEADMNDFGNGAIDIQTLDTTPPAIPVCFSQGALIATPNGEVAVEGLKAGDIVLNATGQKITLRWIAKSHFSWSQILFSRNLWPVCIPAGFLGAGAPHSDLWVSPQHRVALNGWAVELNLGTSEVFLRAKHLMTGSNAPDPIWKNGVDYYHLLFDRHEVVLSNGMPSESFYPGDEALKNIAPEVRAELGAVLAKLAFKSGSALPTASAFEAAALLPYYAPLDMVA